MPAHPTESSFDRPQPTTSAAGRPRTESRVAGRSCSLTNVAMALFVFAMVGLAGMIGSGCGNTRPCRTGTLFLSVKFPAGTTVTSFSVSISVNGQAPKTSSITLPAGQKSGTVEVDFPSGYPSGKSVAVTVTPMNGGTALGDKSTNLIAPAGCAALELDFSGGDAGTGTQDAGRDAGAGGKSAGGSGGGVAQGGTTGQGGMSGQGGSAGGGGKTSGTGGAMPTGGAGGVAGVAGAGGKGQGGGGAGAVGTTGGKGGGGAPGTGGSGTGGTVVVDAGSDRGCVANGAEKCYNGIDDDCNGKTDCEDDSCYSIAQCVTLDSTLGAVGVSLAATANCPAEASVAKTLNSGLTAAACSGCSCTAGTSAVSCSVNLFSYATATECADAAALGTAAGALTNAQGCLTPSWSGTQTGSILGVRIDTIKTAPTGVCAPAGTPTKGNPVWTTTAKFCGAQTVGGGCGAGAACVPRPVVAAGPCLLIDGAKTCPTGLRQSNWSTTFSDTRVCSTCACGSPTGGDCGSTIVAIGSDYSCSDAAIHGYVRNNNRTCLTGTGTYSPGVQFSGTPVAPTCQAQAAMTGTLSATGPQTLCCL